MPLRPLAASLAYKPDFGCVFSHQIFSFGSPVTDLESGYGFGYGIESKSVTGNYLFSKARLRRLRKLRNKKTILPPCARARVQARACA